MTFRFKKDKPEDAKMSPSLPRVMKKGLNGVRLVVFLFCFVVCFVFFFFFFFFFFKKKKKKKKGKDGEVGIEKQVLRLFCQDCVLMVLAKFEEMLIEMGIPPEGREKMIKDLSVKQKYEYILRAKEKQKVLVLNCFVCCLFFSFFFTGNVETKVGCSWQGSKHASVFCFPVGLCKCGAAARAVRVFEERAVAVD
jgi:hypothetical protein